MAQTDGEKELVIGNKQLISLFFVVVALCGVFFAMGYMIGRNTSKPAGANLDTGSAAAPSVVPSATPRSQEPEPPQETARTEAPPAAEPAPPVLTQAAHDVPVTHEAAAPVDPVKVAGPESGATYLQVTALRRADADNLVKTLREQNFPTLIAESSKSDLFRVLVGPYHQTAQVADAKARLKALGFANAFVQK
jgi:cell division septation protein DedD